MTEHAILLAGFGGQGILFAGKVLAQMGLLMGKNVSWLPSYGPEMRGGTASCSVMLSDGDIASPIVTNPTILLAMNQPSLDKFAPCVSDGGVVICDTFLCSGAPGVAATELGGKLANMVMLGKMLKETRIASFEELKAGLQAAIPAHKCELLEQNINAIKLGMGNL